MKIVMPQLGETVTEGTISAWHKNVGDEVEKGDMLLDVETDKVATEIPAPIAGVLQQILVPADETVDVGTVLAVIGDEDDVIETSPAPDASSAAQAGGDDSNTDDSSRSRTRSGRGAAAGVAKLSPAVRRLVAEHDLDIEQVSGTGRDGRVTKQNVLDAIQAKTNAGVAGEPTKAKRIPFDRIRRLTAEHMVRSKATSPHVLQAIDAKFHSVDAVRAAQRDAWRAQHGYSLSYLPFIASAVCRALAEFPRLNASVDGDSLVLHDQINLCIAIDLGEKGLVAPVIHAADRLTVPELATSIKDLADRARTEKLRQDDMTGGTYTLSNPGPFGTLFTAPIINQPQVGILSVDAISKRAVVESMAGSDAILVRPVGVLAQSFDHRAVDGAYSAAFLSRVKQIIEEEDWSKEFRQ